MPLQSESTIARTLSLNFRKERNPRRAKQKGRAQTTRSSFPKSSVGMACIALGDNPSESHCRGVKLLRPKNKKPKSGPFLASSYSLVVRTIHQGTSFACLRSRLCMRAPPGFIDMGAVKSLALYCWSLNPYLSLRIWFDGRLSQADCQRVTILLPRVCYIIHIQQRHSTTPPIERNEGNQGRNREFPG